ncbi:hypothetical protein HAX54_025295, partial [Datura stramonium]|nr:hypothetical protein [Datura stramonium]
MSGASCPKGSNLEIFVEHLGEIGGGGAQAKPGKISQGEQDTWGVLNLVQAQK